MSNKKTLIFVSAFLFVVLGFSLTPRIYSLYTLNTAIDEQGGKGSINDLKERKIEASNDSSGRVTDIALNFVKLNVPLGFQKFQADSENSSDIHMYFFERESDYKSILIIDKFNLPSAIDGFKIYDNNKVNTLIDIENYRSDFELTTFFFRLQPSSVNLLSTLDDIQIAMASLVFRTLYVPFHGSLYKFSLGDKYRGLQFGEVDLNHTVRVNIYDSHKLLFELTFKGMTQQEIDTVLSTMEVKNRSDS